VTPGQLSGGKIMYNDHAESAVLTSPPENSAQYWKRKRRHLSAGKKYPVKWIIMAGVIYLGCLLTIVQAVIPLISSSGNHAFLYPWGLFSLCLYLVFVKGLLHFNEKRWLMAGIPVAVIFPILFIFMHFLTLLPSPGWKGRTVS